MGKKKKKKGNLRRIDLWELSKLAAHPPVLLRASNTRRIVYSKENWRQEICLKTQRHFPLQNVSLSSGHCLVYPAQAEAGAVATASQGQWNSVGTRGAGAGKQAGAERHSAMAWGDTGLPFCLRAWAQCKARVCHRLRSGRGNAKGAGSKAGFHLFLSLSDLTLGRQACWSVYFR